MKMKFLLTKCKLDKLTKFPNCKSDLFVIQYSYQVI